jgi:hypothetical protein
MAYRARSPRRSFATVLVTLSSSLACGGGAFATKDDPGGPGDSGKSSFIRGSGGAADSGANGSGGQTASGSGGAVGGSGHGLGGNGGHGASDAGGAGGTVSAGGKGGSSSGGAPTSTVQLVTSYDRACTTDGDCVVVVEGDVCGCPGCRGAAIARSAQATWDADRKRIYCPAYGAPTTCPAIACAPMLPACNGGLCVARYPHNVDASQYDSSCRTNADCKLIYTGEVCSACQCATAAVNGTGYASYEKDVASDHCTPGPSACDCAPRTAVSCQLPVTMGLGKCVVGP